MNHYTLVSFFAFFQIIMLHSMESQLNLITKKKRSSSIYEKAKQHNKNSLLFCLLPETFNYVMKNVINAASPINHSIRDCLALNVTCTNLNNISYLGKLLQYYSEDEKNESVQKILRQISDKNYWKHRSALFLLTYAGAKDKNLYVMQNVNIMGEDCLTDVLLYDNILLYQATLHNDLKMVQVLFDQKADSNIQDSVRSIFNEIIKTPEMAQLFITNGVNLKSNDSGFDALFASIINNNTTLVEFYLNKKEEVNPRKTTNTGDCILHLLAIHPKTINQEIIQILLKAIPDMINTQESFHGQTPLDRALFAASIFKNVDKTEFIQLLRSAHALTAEELKNNTVIEKNREDSIFNS